MTIYIGVTGLPASGKELVKDFLLDGFKVRNISVFHWSMSNDVRKEAQRLYGNYTREILSATSKSLKEKLGPAAMAIRTLQFFSGELSDEMPDVVIMEAIKNSHEVLYFRENLKNDFLLLGVEAPIELLVNRIISRNRYDEDSKVLESRDAAAAMIQREKGTPGSTTGFDIGYCLSLANFVIINDGDVEDLQKKVNDFIDSKVLPILTEQRVR